MSFGKRLRQLRQEKGLTLRALAKTVGLDFTYLSKIENGKVDYTPSADKIRAIAKALNADELELLKLARKVPPELKALASNPSARRFFRRASETISNPEDWDDLLNYLDQKHKEKQRKKGK